ncbi:neuropathy target esterase sws-like isoform X2 [Apostichopus japonicus]|uniref:neuropathy target esterase sws-like isoform X2 n=1 Tax=Stichopus japonicus TaxID=307972 RepID=UPI003AB7DD1B
MTEVDGRRKFANLFASGLFSQILEEGQNEILKDLIEKDVAKGKDLCDSYEELNKHVFVVDSGAFELSIFNEKSGSKDVIRRVEGQECIYSIFSIADALTGTNHHFPKVYAKALEDSKVYYLPNEKFLALARKDNSFAFRLIQITLSYAIKIINIIHSISGLGPQMWKRTEFNLDEKPVETLSFQSQSDHVGDYERELCGSFSSCALTRERTFVNQETKHKLPSVFDHGVGNVNGLEKVSDESKLLEACQSFMKVLALKGESYTKMLMDYMELYKLPKEFEISKANQEAIGFIFIVDGTVKVVAGNPTKSDSDKEFEEKRGSLLGVYSVITGEAQLYGIKAGESGCTVAILRPASVNQLRKQKSDFVVRLCDYRLRELSPVVRMFDFAVSWISVESGKEVKRDKDHILYVVMGRLRKENTPDQPARDTNVARIPNKICLHLMKQYPEAFFGKIKELLNESSNQSDSNGPQFTGSNTSTVACIRLSEDVRLEKFVEAVGKALLKNGIHYKIWEEGTKLTPETTLRKLAQERMKNIMNCHESNNSINFFLTNYSSEDEWSKLIIRQADLIFVVGNFSAGVKPDIDEIFKGQREEYSADKILVLLHEPNTDGEYEKPKGTAEWLKCKTELSHLHIRCPKNMFVKKDLSDEGLPDATLTPDFHRLARYITGQSYGLVLGGGGARGLAHVGIIETMNHEKVDIDMVGGTSMGAFVGASYCMSTNVEELKQQAALFCKGMNSWWKYLDIDMPYISFTSGSYFNKLLKQIFGADTHFEDLWIPYFNITTDITQSVKVVNTSGPLWQYVRSSMSLAALVPPLCDPKNGHYLLDGGSVDNLPAGEMKHRGCRIVIAVDVGGTEEIEHINYGDSVSSWWLLMKRLSPWCSNTVPDLRTIITRLACLSGEEQLKRVIANQEYIYVRPDRINEFGTLEFEKREEIIQRGRESWKKVATEWREKVKGPS